MCKTQPSADLCVCVSVNKAATPSCRTHDSTTTGLYIYMYTHTHSRPSRAVRVLANGPVNARAAASIYKVCLAARRDRAPHTPRAASNQPRGRLAPALPFRTLPHARRKRAFSRAA